MGNFKYVKRKGTSKKEASPTEHFISTSVKFFQKDNLKNVFAPNVPLFSEFIVHMVRKNALPLSIICVFTYP